MGEQSFSTDANKPAPGDATVTAAPNGDMIRVDKTVAALDPQATRALSSPGQPTPVVETLTETPLVPGYEVLGLLGKGGMGIVYKARQQGLGRVVALKMILHADHAGTQERQRFQAEAEAVAHLQHPNIVQIYEVGEHRGLPYFSLEFCASGSLDDKLDGTPLPPRDAAVLVQTLANAMQAAHEKGILHRDLKPGNVLLAEDGTLKIGDFGLAKRLGEQGQTQTGEIMGSPPYMAPEQAGGKIKEIGPATDIYALGAILYELLTGRPPFKAATTLDTLLQVQNDDPVAVRQLQSKVPKDLETICLMCLHKEPQKRYVCAGALAEDLRRFLAGEPVAARPVGTLERAWRWCRRHPGVAALTASLCVILIMGIFVSSYFAVQANIALRQREEALIQNQQRANRFVDFLRRRPETITLPRNQLIQLFLSENPDITYEELKGAFKGGYVIQAVRVFRSSESPIPRASPIRSLDAESQERGKSASYDGPIFGD